VRLVAAGDIANLYAMDGAAALLKLPRLPGDNDLTAACALTTLDRDGTGPTSDKRIRTAVSGRSG
jgi:hypothetical protein